MKKAAVILTAGCLGGAALGHTGVQNPAVLARMDNMTDMADRMEVLVPMARGAAPFDADRAAAAFDDLAQLAAAAPDLFRAPETDPRSEALPVIWEAFDDFEARATELQGLAATASAADRDAVVAAVREIGASCSGCHERYRLETED